MSLDIFQSFFFFTFSTACHLPWCFFLTRPTFTFEGAMASLIFCHFRTEIVYKIIDWDPSRGECGRKKHHDWTHQDCDASLIAELVECTVLIFNTSKYRKSRRRACFWLGPLYEAVGPYPAGEIRGLLMVVEVGRGPCLSSCVHFVVVTEYDWPGWRQTTWI